MSNIPDDVYLKNIKKIGNSIENIHVIENFLNEEEVSILCSEAKNDIYNKKIPGEWNNRLSDQDLLSEESKSILRLAHIKILNMAKKIYGVDIEFANTQDDQTIVRWPEGYSMGEHIDDFAKFHYNISTVIYINDNYEGGEIRFVDHDFTIKPKSGTLILFPGNKYYSHEVLEVKGGDRYTSAFWLKFIGSSFVGDGRGLGLVDVQDWKNIDWENNIEDWRKNENKDN
jgi:hypothetical protein